MEKPLILVTNDDGISSRGIKLLIDIMSDFGEVLVVAPDSPQSGMGHAVTVGNTLRLNETRIYDGIKAYRCSGTPVDCVKLAKHYLLKDNKPDLLVSGINHGPNTSISVVYSGTMGAAIEATIDEIPAIGFSLCDYAPDADFTHTKPGVIKITEQVLKNGLPPGVSLNVNFPAKSDKPIKGIKICRQARAKWKEDFDDRIDPYGEPYFWMAGNLIMMDKGEDNDIWAIQNNYISIVPTQHDFTSHNAIKFISEKWEDLDL